MPPVAFLILTSALFSPSSESSSGILIVAIFVDLLGYLTNIPVGVPIS
jgi:hypothetical protein